jgi:MerR family transcriptional regulator, mercuric resistance operon regulatory protein
VESFTIGGLAAAAGVSVETVRYYERRGLLEQPVRSVGYRRYSPADVERLAFVRRAKTFGFTLSEVTELLARPGGSCDVLAAARAKQGEVDDQIRRLQAVSRRLGQLVAVCENGGDDCASLAVGATSADLET